MVDSAVCFSFGGSFLSSLPGPQEKSKKKTGRERIVISQTFISSSKASINMSQKVNDERKFLKQSGQIGLYDVYMMML